jgi:hypothetical protein
MLMLNLQLGINRSPPVLVKIIKIGFFQSFEQHKIFENAFFQKIVQTFRYKTALDQYLYNINIREQSTISDITEKKSAFYVSALLARIFLIKREP